MQVISSPLSAPLASRVEDQSASSQTQDHSLCVCGTAESSIRIAV
jgi:hypothetical protein